MALPSLAVINFTSTLEDNEVLDAIHAVNRQMTENFMPIWGIGRTLMPLVPNFDPTEDPDSLAEEPVPADSVMYLVDESTVEGALGFHDLNTHDTPFGFVFVLDPADWTTTLSHEVLELILDPTATVLVPGPDPRDANNTVLHAYEACDAVERLSYSIGTVLVSDFVTPSYFTLGEAEGQRNDFLGVGLGSFGVTSGSHIAFFNLASGSFETVFGRQKPTRAAMLKRFDLHDRHPKPARPSDARLDELFGKYRASAIGRRAAPASNVRAITRTARYTEAAARLRRTMVAPQH